LLRQAADALYRLWAAARLRLTGRPDLEELCRQRAGAGGEARCRI
jgi:predicted DCC family thiol-disulfide oxidoreductase YuxK